MMAIDKVTFGYSSEEDRISVNTQSSSGERLRLWLTYRLVRQLIPHLVRLIASDMSSFKETATDEGQGEVRPKSMARETAIECSESGPEFLLNEIDLAQRDNKLIITFRGQAMDESAVLGLSCEASCEMVESLQKLSEKAGWRVIGKRPDTPQFKAKIVRDITIH